MVVAVAVMDPCEPVTGPLTKEPDEPLTTCQKDDVAVTVVFVYSPSAKVSSMTVVALSCVTLMSANNAGRMHRNGAGMAVK